MIKIVALILLLFIGFLIGEYGDIWVLIFSLIPLSLLYAIYSYFKIVKSNGLPENIPHYPEYYPYEEYA